MTKHNINDSVTVTLTETGVQRVQKYWDDQRNMILGSLPASKRGEYDKLIGDYFTDRKEVPLNRVTNFESLEELMQIFGPTLPWLTPADVCFEEGDIIINEPFRFRNRA